MSCGSSLVGLCPVGLCPVGYVSRVADLCLVGLRPVGMCRAAVGVCPAVDLCPNSDGVLTECPVGFSTVSGGPLCPPADVSWVAGPALSGAAGRARECV